MFVNDFDAVYLYNNTHRQWYSHADLRKLNIPGVEDDKSFRWIPTLRSDSTEAALMYVFNQAQRNLDEPLEPGDTVKLVTTEQLGDNAYLGIFGLTQSAPTNASTHVVYARQNIGEATNFQIQLASTEGQRPRYVPYGVPVRLYNLLYGVYLSGDQTEMTEGQDIVTTQWSGSDTDEWMFIPADRVHVCVDGEGKGGCKMTSGETNLELGIRCDPHQGYPCHDSFGRFVSRGLEECWQNCGKKEWKCADTGEEGVSRLCQQDVVSPTASNYYQCQQSCNTLSPESISTPSIIGPNLFWQRVDIIVTFILATLLILTALVIYGIASTSTK